MFQLKYFKSTNNLVPTGWTEVDDDKSYSTLASRAPQIPDDESVPSTDRTESESDEDEDQNSNAFVATRMNDESSDEDELSGPTPVVSSTFQIFTPSLSSRRDQKPSFVVYC